MTKFKEKKEKFSKPNIPSKTNGFIKKKTHKFGNEKVVKKYMKTFNKVSEKESIVPKNEDNMDSISNHKKEPDSINFKISFSPVWEKYKPRQTPHIKSGSDWISELLTEEIEGKPIPLSLRKRLKELAEKILNDDLQAHKLAQEKQSKYENKQFHKAVLSRGTTKDKISAYTYQCMDSPVYSLNDLFLLIEFVSPKFKSNFVEAVENVKTLFQTTLLPKGQVAKEFECHNFLALIPLIKTNREQAEKQLVLWYFESQIQLAYLKFIDNLEHLCHDFQAKTKTQGIRGLQIALKHHPRQNAELVLQKLVNKFGDSSKISGDILNVLTNLQFTRPQLKVTIVSLIEELLYRPNISSKSQYYGLCFLKDIVFGKNDDALVEKLIKVYFDFFQNLSKSGEVESRFMGALLRGLNRAYPFLQGKRVSYLEEQMNVLYKLCHMVNFNIATQALQLIYQVQGSSDEISDRFYSVLYAKLLDPSFGSSSANGAFLNIVFKAIVRDTNVARVCALIRRLLQVTKYQFPHIACAALFLVSEAVKDNPNIKAIKPLLMSDNIKTEAHPLANDEGDDDDDDYEFYPDLDTDHEEEEEEEEKEEKEEEEEEEESSQMDTSGEISEITESPRKLKRKSSHTSPTNLPDNKNKVKPKIKTESSWCHRENLAPSSRQQDVRTLHYDPTVRNPLFSGADLTSVWEMQDLVRHFHPTVSLFASNLVNETHITYSGDPIQDFTLTRFLNRFTHRNPKKVDVEKNKLGNLLGSRAQYIPQGARSMAVESKNFSALKIGKVPVEDMFFYNYFTKYRKPKDPRREGDDDDDDDDDDGSIDDDEFDEYLSRMNSVKAKKFSSPDDDDDDDDIDEDMDFANNAVAVSDDENEDEDEEFDGEEEFEDEREEDKENGSEGSFGDDEEDDDDDGGEDFDSLSEGDFSDDESEEEVVPKSKRGAKAKKPATKSGSGKWDSMLADADDFSQLLEDNADDPFAGTSEEVHNKDKSSAKQLLWERNREVSMGRNKGFSGKRTLKDKKAFKKGKETFKKRKK